MGRKSGRSGRQKPGDKDLVDRQLRRRRREAAEPEILPPCLVDSPAQAENERDATVTPASRFSPYCSVPSYFLCHKCSKDTEEEECVITFCGHVFCWFCLHQSITSQGINRLRGACPSCHHAVDLCPRTKTVCPIYYVEGPQAFPPKFREMNIREIKIDSRGKRKIEDNNDRKSATNQGSKTDGSDESYTEIMKERLKSLIKVDPSKRPSDMRPFVNSSFITFAIHDSGALKGSIFFPMHNLFSKWKSTKDELNNIILKIQSLCEELSLKLVNEHERGLQASADLLGEMPAKIQRTDSLSCVKTDMSKNLTEEINPILPSGSSSSFYFSCNVCCGNATFRQPIITYCGHVFCWACFDDHILQCDFSECPVCKSAVDVSTACPISVNGEAGKNQNCKIWEEWQNAVLFLNPSAVQLQIHSMIYDIDHEIADHTENFYETIRKLVASMNELYKGIKKHTVHTYNYYLSEEKIQKYFPKDNFGQVLVKPSIKSPNNSNMLAQEVHTDQSVTSTPPSLGSHFCCGCCHKHTLADPVVTYCSHLFCWPCLYLEINANGSHDEDGSLHGACPVCHASNIVFSKTTAKLTVIPICKGMESIRKEHKRPEEEDRTREIPPCPSAKRISLCGLKTMRDCVSETMCKLESLTYTLQVKMDKNEKILDYAYEIVKMQRHRLLLGLSDGWRWLYKDDRVPDVVGTDDTDTRLIGLSRSWLDVVDVESACTLFNEKEVLGDTQVAFLTS